MKFTRLFAIFAALLMMFGVSTNFVQAQSEPGDIFGQVSPPPGVQSYNDQAGGGQSIGIIIFFSNMLKIATVVAGLIVFLNLIIAGFNYITSDGDSAGVKKVQESVKNSVIGLFLIVVSYTITAVISLAFFGDANFILNPTIQGPTAPGIVAPGP